MADSLRPKNLRLNFSFQLFSNLTMSLPLIFPKVDGPGRLLEIATFRRSQIPDSKFKETFDTVMRISSQLPILRQILVGGMSSGERMSVIIADWTSAEEKDVVEPSTRIYNGGSLQTIAANHVRADIQKPKHTK